jgi:FMN reductase
MPLVAAISGSPSPSSRTTMLVRYVTGRLEAEGLAAELVEVRDLPAEDLLLARPSAPALAAALGLVERADAVVIATPIYKAAYSGVLKSFLDLLPQSGLTGKVVLPLATGGSLAHVLAIDYALRPVLSSLNPLQVVSSLFVVEKQIERTDAGVVIAPELAPRVDAVVAEFARAVRRAVAGAPLG